MRLKDASSKTIVLTGSRSRAAVLNSDAHISSPPSPVNATTVRDGSASAAPIAEGKENPIVARPFEISMSFGLDAAHRPIAGNMWAPASTVTRAPTNTEAAASTTTDGANPSRLATRNASLAAVADDAISAGAPEGFPLSGSRLAASDAACPTLEGALGLLGGVNDHSPRDST